MIEVFEGDAVEQLGLVPDGAVQCCVTSPPYWGLRDYGTARWDGGDAGCDHAKPNRNAETTTMTGVTATLESRHFYRDTCAKCGARRVDSQLGLEVTPGEYVTKLVAVFREVWRVLRDDGTVWLNLGDSYARQAGDDSKKAVDSGLARTGRTGKSAELFKEGCNTPPPGLKPKDLVGIPWRVAFALQADGWYLRQDIIWAKPNPMPESVTDRCTKSHEYIFLLTKSQRYYYDAEAIAEPLTTKPHAPGNLESGRLGSGGRTDNCVHQNDRIWGESGIRNRRSVWTITTEPYPEAHFATFPTAIPRLCILAGTKPGDTVLDPFAGSGTTGQVAVELGRRAILIELNPVYADLIRQRTTTTMGLGL